MTTVKNNLASTEKPIERVSALQELQAYKQWVVWCLEPEKDNPARLTKVPYNARTSKKASSTGKSTWSTYNEACNAKARLLNTNGKPYDGIGYVFNRDIAGIDLDHCIDEAGNIDAWAQDILNRLNSYAETSPSGAGIHIFVRGSLPEHKKGTKRPVPNQRDPLVAIEIYDSGRYFTVTGNHLADTPTVIESRQEELHALYTEITAKPKREKPPVVKDQEPADMDDNTLIDIAIRARNGGRFQALWQGDISGYANDDSRADAALCAHLAFWTQCDKARMDRLFRRSRLYRDKWDRPTGESTYGELTLNNAIANCKEVYTPQNKEKRIAISVLNARKSSDTQSNAETTGIRDNLPAIFIGGQMRDTTAKALDALAAAECSNPTLFVQSASLVKVGRNEDKRPIIMHIGVAEVKNALTDAANFYRLKSVGAGVFEPVPVSPPKELAEALLALEPTQWPFPPLSAIVETPVMRPNGTILDTPGYDPETHLYYVPQADIAECKVPLEPTQQDIDQALALIWDTIGEFPYADQADKANALALLMTPILRPAIKGHIPLALIDAPKQGTGKGLLSDCVSIIGTGASARILTMSSNDEEVKKTITSLLIEGATIITIDNVDGKLQSKHLDGALTAYTWTDRFLGQSRMVTLPQRATFLATGNNIHLGGDLARRSYRIRLDPHVSRPWLRTGFKHEDLATWVTEHRSELITAILILARAWFGAGKPLAKNIPPLGTFTNWAKTLGGILDYVGVSGLLSNLEQLYSEIDEDSDQWESFLFALNKVYGEQQWITSAEIVKKLKDEADSSNNLADSSLFQYLPEKLQIAFNEKPLGFTIRLGRALEKQVDTCYGDENLCLQRDKDNHTKEKKWRIVRIVADSSLATRESMSKASVNDDIANLSLESDNENNNESRRENYPQLSARSSGDNTPNRSTSGVNGNSSHRSVADRLSAISELSATAPSKNGSSPASEREEVIL